MRRRNWAEAGLLKETGYQPRRMGGLEAGCGGSGERTAAGGGRAGSFGVDNGDGDGGAEGDGCAGGSLSAGGGRRTGGGASACGGGESVATEMFSSVVTFAAVAVATTRALATRLINDNTGRFARTVDTGWETRAVSSSAPRGLWGGQRGAHALMRWGVSVKAPSQCLHRHFQGMP